MIYTVVRQAEDYDESDVVYAVFSDEGLANQLAAEKTAENDYDSYVVVPQQVLDALPPVVLRTFASTQVDSSDTHGLTHTQVIPLRPGIDFIEDLEPPKWRAATNLKTLKDGTLTRPIEITIVLDDATPEQIAAALQNAATAALQKPEVIAFLDVTPKAAAAKALTDAIHQDLLTSPLRPQALTPSRSEFPFTNLEKDLYISFLGFTPSPRDTYLLARNTLGKDKSIRAFWATLQIPDVSAFADRWKALAVECTRSLPTPPAYYNGTTI